MTISVVGLGLIGGSIAKDLKNQINVEVLGVDLNESHQKLAMELGLIHRVVTLDEAIEKSEVIILAIPVDKIESLLPSVLDKISGETVVTDVGSTKAEICRVVDGHKNRSRYVAAHPLAGTEFSGPKAAISHLFVGKKNIICDKEKSDASAVDTIVKVFNSIGMHTYFLSSEEHDKHLAYVSHLSHVSSFMLGLTVLDIEKDEKQIFNLASTGFASTVRLAKSNPSTWSPIFHKNGDNLVKALESYIDYLHQFKEAIKSNDYDKAESLMKDANDIKRILN